jgi:hypothetical protein
MESSMQKISFPVDLVNAILQYLDTRPHREVRQIIDAMQKEANEQIKAEQASDNR